MSAVTLLTGPLSWIESHPGTAAWVQAIGAMVALFVAIFVPAWMAKKVRPYDPQAFFSRALPLSATKCANASTTRQRSATRVTKKAFCLSEVWQLFIDSASFHGPLMQFPYTNSPDTKSHRACLNCKL
jgi:hypothetical protein